MRRERECGVQEGVGGFEGCCWYMGSSTGKMLFVETASTSCRSRITN
jgi:hypothetical protein